MRPHWRHPSTRRFLSLRSPRGVLFAGPKGPDCRPKGAICAIRPQQTHTMALTMLKHLLTCLWQFDDRSLLLRVCHAIPSVCASVASPHFHSCTANMSRSADGSTQRGQMAEDTQMMVCALSMQRCRNGQRHSAAAVTQRRLLCRGAHFFIFRIRCGPTLTAPSLWHCIFVSI